MGGIWSSDSVYVSLTETPIAWESCASATAKLFCAVTSCTLALASAVMTVARLMSGWMPVRTNACVCSTCFSWLRTVSSATATRSRLARAAK